MTGTARAVTGSAVRALPKWPVAAAATLTLVAALTGGCGGSKPRKEAYERRCAAFPVPSCTGVPPGTKLTLLPLNVENAAYRVRDGGKVLDKVHIPGDLLITADDVTIRDSQIDGGILDEYGGKTYSFTITDSTVGPEHGCLSAPAVGSADYRAAGLHIRGHGDGFRASGDRIRIQDSFVLLCSNPGDHSDGVQTYHSGTGLVFDHNTVDQRAARDITAPIFIADPGTADVTVTDNLVMGGTYSIQVRNVRGTQVVRGNRLVNRSWVYGPVDSDCTRVTWSGNTLVTIDAGYRVTSTVGPLGCV